MSSPPFEHDPHSARARWLLVAGATLGLAAATATLLTTPEASDSLPDAIVARVNGTPIRTESYLRLLDALAADRRNPLSDADRKHVLDRLIEEELLVQHAVDLGLVRTDRRVRANLVSAILASLNATADAIEPSESELEAFYRDNLGYFRLPARWRVQEVFIASPGRGQDGTDARLRAEQVTARLRAGESIDRLREVLGDTVVAPLPNVPLPPAKLREYLGPSVLDAVRKMAPGETSEPIETPQGFHVVQLVAHVESRAPAFEDVRSQVRAEVKRRAGDKALRNRLDALRKQADIQLRTEMP